MNIETIRKKRMREVPMPEAARYSQESVACVIGVTRQTIANWDEHPEIVPIGKAKLLADYLGCTVEDLFS